MCTDAKSDCPLTPNQLEIVTLLSFGKTSEEIGMILGVSRRAIERRLDRAWRASETYNRASLVAKALREGWIE